MANYLYRLVACTIGIVLVGCAASSPPRGATANLYPGYVTNSNGEVARSYGTCTRTTAWTPDKAIRQCDPNVVAVRDAERAKAEAAAANAEAAAAKEKANAEAAAPAAAATAAAASQSKEPVWKTVEAEAFFDVNATEPTAASKRALDDIAQRALDAQEAKLKVIGYADPTGDADANMALSQRRADSVRSYLTAHGVPESDIEVQAKGEAAPKANCEGRHGKSLSECLQPDRRSQVQLSVLVPAE